MAAPKLSSTARSLGESASARTRNHRSTSTEWFSNRRALTSSDEALIAGATERPQKKVANTSLLSARKPHSTPAAKSSPGARRPRQELLADPHRLISYATGAPLRARERIALRRKTALSVGADEVTLARPRWQRAGSLLAVRPLNRAPRS